MDALRRELYGRDPVAGSRYVRDFHEEFRRVQEVSSYDDLVVACYRADVVLLGEYHALADHQAFASRLLEDLSRRSSRTVLALEMVYARHQPALDAWLRGRASDEELRARIRFDLDWGYGWSSALSLLDTARRLGLPVFGVDGPTRGGLKTVRRRDRLAGERLAEICASHPGAHVLVLFGESHLARGHLPRFLRRSLRRRDLERRLVRVVQDVDEVYWELLGRGLEHREVVWLSRAVYAVVGGSPLRKYEAYRRILERWNAEEPEDEPDLAPTVHAMIETILRYLKIDPWRRRVSRGGPRIVDLYPEVYGPPEQALVGRILRDSGLEPEERVPLLARLREGGSFYVPVANLVLLGSHRLRDAGEEASHFVHQILCGRVGRPRGEGRRTDLFYRSVLEEALGYFGSKIIDPSRNIFFEAEVYRSARDRRASGGKSRETRILDFILAHRRLEASDEREGKVPEEVRRGLETEGPLASSFAHHLGYFLGHRLYEAHRAGTFRRVDLLRLFRDPFEAPGRAVKVYFDLASALEAGVTSD